MHKDSLRVHLTSSFQILETSSILKMAINM